MGVMIAIDGPAAAGKGTLSRRVAETYGLAYLDTGALYRGVAWTLLDADADPANETAAQAAAERFSIDDIKNADIRTAEVGAAASVVAAQPAVRAALLDYQRRFASEPPGGAKGAVLDGRDVGTVVCPDADVKLFVTASAEARAHRRWLELKDKNPNLTEASLLEDLKARDKRDAERADAPMKPADDAVLINTTDLSIEAAFVAARRAIDAVLRQG
ncbi:MAG: (d)CMP kinase [Pseudomonadota bacterium]